MVGGCKDHEWISLIWALADYYGYASNCSLKPKLCFIFLRLCAAAGFNFINVDSDSQLLVCLIRGGW